MSERVTQIVLRIVLMAASLASAAALLVGGLAAIFALWPGTDLHDASVFIKYAPLWISSGIAGLLLTRWLRRGLIGPSSTEDDSR